MNVEVSGAHRVDIDQSELVRFTASILESEAVDEDSVLSVTFVGRDAITDLNREFMSKDGPTDVLSFPIEDASPGKPPHREADGPPLELGDNNSTLFGQSPTNASSSAGNNNNVLKSPTNTSTPKSFSPDFHRILNLPC